MKNKNAKFHTITEEAYALILSEKRYLYINIEHK